VKRNRNQERKKKRMNKKPMIDQSFDEVGVAFDAWLETLSQDELDQLNELIDSIDDELSVGEVIGEVIEDDEPGVQIFVEDDEVAPKEEKMEQPKAVKVKCRCCGFAKKPRRVNAEGICKVCYVALATSEGNEVTVVGRQGLKGRNTVSVVVGGVRVKVQRKVRLES
jgi:hypothetical protein